ncbi:MAG: ABC transporter substrate-binding protein [Streptosporangiales bacterium]|jgi:ABC-type branched-subunit amino acid transport system substrate-binding protein|nr:ABC transporter substrate-binding protein [Streptosporangiales bacterium]
MPKNRSSRPGRTARIVAAAGTAAALTLAAAACGSPSSASGSPGSSSGSTTFGLKGKPILIGTMGPVQSSTLSEPWIEQGARIGGAAVNASGGIDGRPVKVDFCDDHGTAQGGSVCAQKLLVQDKVTMMVGDDGTEEPALIPALSSASTISFGSMGASQASLDSSRVFIIDPVEAEYWVMPRMFPKTTHKVVYLPEESAIAQAAAKGNTAYLPEGVTAAAPITIPSSATSMQQYCLQIKSSGADTVIPTMNPDQVATLIQTCAQVGVTKVLWAISTFEVTPQVVNVLSQLHEKNVITLGLGGGNVEKEFAADIAKYGPKVGGITNTIAEPAINAWLAYKLLPQVVKGAGSLNPAAIRSYLDKQSAFTTMGATAPIDFTKTPISVMPRLKNLSATEAEAQNGKVVVLDPKPFSLKP